MPPALESRSCQYRPEALDVVRRYGCVTGGDAIARQAGLTHGSLQYSLACAWRHGALVAYAVSARTRAWCADASLRQLAGGINGGVAVVRVRDIAVTAARLIERGMRYVTPGRVMRAMGQRGARWVHDIIAATLRYALGGAAELHTRHAGRGWLVADPRAAVESLRRLAEAGVLPLDPLPPPPPPAPRRRVYDGLVSVNVPREYVRIMDALVAAGLYPSRGEVVRCAIRELLRRYGLAGGAQA
jgi:hypothetical protein